MFGSIPHTWQKCIVSAGSWESWDWALINMELSGLCVCFQWPQTKLPQSAAQTVHKRLKMTKLVFCLQAKQNFQDFLQLC